MNVRRACLALVVLASALSVRAWDYEGHRSINQLALAGLPADFPGFVKAPEAAERIAFLAGEPDRWRNVPDLIMRQSGGSWLDHFLDVEHVTDAGMDPKKVPGFRYDFAVAYAAGRAAHPAHFPAIDPAKNSDHTREWPGFLPWAIAEYQARLRSGFSYLKAYQETGGTAAEIANAEANIIYIMGTMGHYVGDAAQPLHTTVHHNGWVGPNPEGFTTWTRFHSWIDGGFFEKAGVKPSALLPRARPGKLFSLAPSVSDEREPMFLHILDYFLTQHAQLVPLYAAEKAGKFKADDTPGSTEGRELLEQQILTAGEMLSSLWLTAWRTAVPDVYLRGQLVKRATANTPVPPPPTPAAPAP